MIATTGHSWQQVREDWDLPRVEAWFAYCEQFPPLRAMVQAYLGVKPKKPQAAGTSGDDLLAELGAFPGAVQTE